MIDVTEESERSATESGADSPVAASPVAHLSAAERAARGKAARTEVPRASHAEWEPSSARPDPIALLEQQAQTRVPELVPIRYGRMLVSPFTFYRGAALMMAADLAATPRSGLTVQLCGDAHLSNFGVFASPERRLVFDVNDFDETLPGPVGVGRQAPRREPGGRRRATAGSRPSSASAVVLAAVGAYRTAMRDFAGDDEPRCLVRAPRHREARCAEYASAVRSRSRSSETEPRSPRRGRRTACRPSPS